MEMVISETLTARSSIGILGACDQNVLRHICVYAALQTKDQDNEMLVRKLRARFER